MDKILIKETKTVHELIIKAIASCRKDDDGFVDCMNVGKSIAYEGYCFEHKLSDIICREEYLFETKVIQKGGGTIRVVRLKDARNDKKQNIPKYNSNAPRIPNIEEVKNLVNDWKIGTNPIVGQYYYNSEKSYYGFRYIATLTFNDLTYLDEKEVEIVLNDPIESLTINEFYEFQWVIVKCNDQRGYRMDVMPGTTFKSIEPKQLVNRLHKVWANCDPTISNQMKNTMKMVSTQLTASSDGTFIYELLQNANDYPMEDESGNPIPVNVEFHITGEYLIYRHSGDFFTPRNIAAISKLAAGEKKAKKNAIGYKGIGFKTIFNGNDYAYLRTGEYSLRFDESSRISRDDPWQIMPIWTDNQNVDRKVKQLFDKGEERFRVQMAIRPKDQNQLRGDEKNAYEYLFLDIFKDEKDILFVPNLHSVQIFIDGLPRKKCTKRSNNWVLTQDPYVYSFTENEIKDINAEVLASDGKIPDKYKNFEDTRVMFACRRNGKNLSAVEGSTVNCYLPTQAKFGFPFMFNTDMIPTGPRDNIEPEIKLNERFAKIAGRKFVEWIRDLVLSGDYSYKSIFNLIPDFDYCREHHSSYKKFITAFENGFKEALVEIPIVPVIKKDDVIAVEKICNVLFDTTKITETNVMTDEEFMRFLNSECNLPHTELRKDCDSFNKLFTTFHNQEKEFTEKNLILFCENNLFLDWMSIKSNNIKFISFIYKKKWLKNYSNKKIFLSEDNGNQLYNSGDLYFDDVQYIRARFVEYTSQLNCLSYDFIKILNSSTDMSLDEYSVKNMFKAFSAKTFIDNILFNEENSDKAIKYLSTFGKSIDFIHTLAYYGIADSKYKFLPLFDINKKLVDDYNRCVYFDSTEAEVALNHKWLDKEWASIISNEYFVKDESFNNSILAVISKLGVKSFSNKSFIKEIILNQNNLITLSANISTDLTTNVSFVKYLFSNIDSVENNQLIHFPLFVQDAKGNETTHVNDVDEKIFIYAESYNEHAKKLWIEKDWMYSLNEDYFNLMVDTGNDKDLQAQKKEIQSFFQDKFDVKSFGQANFYYNVLTKKLDAIYSKLTNEELLLDFYNYLNKNYDILFEGNGNIRGEKTFASMPYINGNDEIIATIDSQAVKYLYSEEVISFNQELWLPANLVITSSTKYSTYGTKVLEKLGFGEYNMTDFFNSVIFGKKAFLLEGLKNYEKNVSFHKFMISHRADIALTELQNKLPNYPVFLTGANNQKVYSSTSTGHNLSSPEILKFVDNGIISINDIDIIDSAYMVSGAVDYWCNILKNNTFDLSRISLWLTKTKYSLINTFATDNQKQDGNKNNVILWNTIKDVYCNTEDIKVFNALPFIAKNQNIEKVSCIFLYLNSNPKTYISDAYRTQKGTDAQLKKYDPKDAYLVDERYLQGDTSVENITSWFNFWKKLGVKHEITEILISSVIPKLHTLDLFDVASVLLSNRDELKEKGYDIDKFISLRVQTIDNTFQPVSEVRLIKGVENEPIKSIRLRKQINDSYTSEVKNFILEIAEKAQSKNIITSEDEWVNRKIKFIKSSLMVNLNSEQDNLRGISRGIYEPLLHDIILYCAKLYQTKELPSKPYAATLKELLIKGEDGIFHVGSDLTLGSSYLPKTSKHGACDFQGNGIKANSIIKYLSKEYLEYDNWVVVRDFFTKYWGVHFKFEEKHIPLLENHQFALYFWNIYISMPDMLDSVQKLITDNKITAQTKCVPTATETEKPCNLYNRKTIGNMVKRIPEKWPTLICDESIPSSIDGKDNPIDKISGYKEQLSGKHCFLYLENSDPSHHELRRKALEWIIADKANITAEDITKYRDSSTSYWLNCDKKKMLIKNMCAIDPTDAYIVQHFSTDPHILQETLFPSGKLNEVCSLLRIDVLSKQKSFTATPLNYKTESLECKRVLNQRSLLLAAIVGKEDSESWQEAYKAYKVNVDKCSFVNCGSIELTCKIMPDIKNDDAIMFFRDTDTETFYYVEKWQGKVFYEEFVKACSEALEVPSSADMMLVGNILDEDLSIVGLTKLVDRYCSLLLEDKDFYEELILQFPGLTNKLSLRETVEETDTNYDVPAETSISTKKYESTEEESETHTGDIPDTTESNEDDMSTKSSGIRTEDGHETNEQEDQNIKHNDSSTTEAKVEKQVTKEDSGNVSSASRTYNTDTSSTGNQERTRKPETTSRTEPMKRTQELSTRTRKPQKSVLYEEDSISEKYKPKGNNADITDWKKKQQQIELGVADPNSSELEACRSLIDSSKNDNEIIDEQYLSRYRLYNYLTNVEGIELGDKREFVNNKSKGSFDLDTNKGYIHARSAKGGILFISKFLWEKLNEEGHRLCMYYGNKGSEFKLIDSVSQLIELVGDDNIIVQVKGSEKYNTIQSIFSGSLKENGRAYVLIRIKSNERYNALFVNIYNNNDDNDAGF